MDRKRLYVFAPSYAEFAYHQLHRHDRATVEWIYVDSVFKLMGASGEDFIEVGSAASEVYWKCRKHLDLKTGKII